MKLLYDNGKLRKCPKNIIILGFWKSLFIFYNYKDILRNFPLSEVINGLKLIPQLILWILLIPILPALKCFFDLRRYRKEYKKEELYKNE